MKRLLGAVAGFLMVGTVLAQANTTAGTATNVQWGQKILSSVNGATSQFWFRGSTQNNRSYCVESSQIETGGFGDKPTLSSDTNISVFKNDGTTLVTSNDDATNEPKVEDLSRACWIADANSRNLIQLTSFTGVPAQDIQLRFTETTLFCPWFFIAGDYNAFTLIRNNSNTALNSVLVTYYSLNGTLVGQTLISIPADGAAVINARSVVPDPVAVPNGTITISHTGSPQQISGSTTTLSGTTGLSFDAQFTQRNPW
jgi:hypothetical protein